MCVHVIGLILTVADHRSTDLLDNPAAHSIYHVFHPVAVAWQTVLTGLKDAGLEFDTIEPDQWLERVDASIRADEQDPSAGMIAMWREAVSAISYHDLEARLRT